MRFERLALAGTAVQHRGTGPESRRYNLALGALAAYAQARQPGLEVAIREFPLDLAAPALPEQAAERILDSDPDVVGVSLFCWDLDAFEPVVRRLKQLSPRVRLLAGGPSVTFAARAILQRLTALDAVVPGEGEETLAEVLERGLGDPGAIPGLVWRAAGGFIGETAPRAPIADLGSLPSPYRAGLVVPPRSNFMLECSRGCVFRCKYCAWKNYGGGVRYLPTAAVRDQLRFAVERGCDHVFILDSALNFDEDRLRALAGAIRAEVPDQRVAFSFFVSHQHFRPEQVEILAGIRPHELNVGLETVDAAVLRSIGRAPLDETKFAAAIESLSALGPVTISVILGIPTDGLDGFRRTLDYLARLRARGRHDRIRAIRVFWMIVTPGSVFDGQREQLGIETVAPGAPYLRASASFPERSLAQAVRLMAEHELRDVLVWEDPWPGLHLAGLEDLKAPPSLPAARLGDEGDRTLDLAALLPGLVPGAEATGGWILGGTTTTEGWPVLRFERSGRTLEVEIRRRDPARTCYRRTRRHDLLWLAPPGDRHAAARNSDASVGRLLEWIATAIERNE
jgi:hypothetical protein